MFERFSDDARRSLFFARAKTAERDGDSITDMDLLDGIMMAAPPERLARLTAERTGRLTPSETADEFTRRLEQDRVPWLVRSKKEIPFAAEAKTVLQLAVEEADGLGHKYIRPEHLILGLLRDETEACQRLREAGVLLPDARRAVAEDPRGDGDSAG